MKTNELIQKLGLAPDLDWKRGWKVLRKVVDDTGRLDYISYGCPYPLHYVVEVGTTKFFDEGPLTGFRYLKEAVSFLEGNCPLAWGKYPRAFTSRAVLRMLYTPYTGDSRGLYRVWQEVCQDGHRFMRGREEGGMPTGTVYATTIVIYGEEVKLG